MKKIINTILTVALAAMAIQTYDILAANKRVYQGRRGNTQLSARQKRVRRALQARRMRQQREKALANNPTARKKGAQIEQKITQNTQALEKSVEQQKTAKTPAEKEIAKKTTAQLANELLASLKEERTYSNDIYHGYGAKEKEAAELILTKLYPMQKKLGNALTQKERDLAQVTNAGIIWNEAQKGKEKEYNDLSAQVTKLKNTLSRIDAAIKDQKIIAGLKWSNALNALATAGIFITGAVGGDIVLTGGATTMAVATKAAELAKNSASWVQEKGLAAWNMLPNMRSVPMPDIKIDPNSATVDGKEIQKAAVSSQFGNVLAEATWGTFAMAKQIAVQMAVSAAFTTAVRKLTALLNDPATTPAQLDAQNKEVQKLAAQQKATK